MTYLQRLKDQAGEIHRSVCEEIENQKQGKNPEHIDKMWMVWSQEHNGWWRPAKQGYTNEIREAGKYCYEEALDITRSANWAGRFEEAMVPVTDEFPRRLK